MKILQRMISVAISLICVCATVLPVKASTYTEYDGLQVSVEMDREHYEEGEPITATITVTNTNDRTVTIVNLEQLIPAGYVLAEGSEVSKNNVPIQSGETIVLKVTFEGQSAEEPEGEAVATGFVDKLLYGYTWGIPNLLLALIVVAAVVVFMILT